jgi:cysteine-rich repeat protein
MSSPPQAKLIVRLNQLFYEEGSFVTVNLSMFFGSFLGRVTVGLMAGITMAVVIVQMQTQSTFREMIGEVVVSSSSAVACVEQGDSCEEDGSPACCPGTECTSISFGYGFCALIASSSESSAAACVDQGDSCEEDGSPACCPGTECTSISFGYGFCALIASSSSASSIGTCGDSMVDEGEACDGGGIDTESCNANCTLAQCGDAHTNVPYGEECDDGGTVGGDGCSSMCQIEECGNSVTDVGESCDGGGIDTMSCNANCTAATCGDGHTNLSADEECDDGGTAGGDGCSAECQVEECGNGVTDVGEDCDDGGIDTMSCNADCSAPICGDSHVNTAAGEECDVGDAIEGDGCNSTCQVEECGNGVKDSGEECDGSDLGGLQCSDFGPPGGTITCDELCGIDTSACEVASSSSSSTSSAICGNTIVEGDEQCDGGACCSNECTYFSNSTLCRSTSGVCDVAEYCTGSSATCPSDLNANAGVSCRAATNECDEAELCTGSAKLCPADSYKANGTSCQSGAGTCIDNVCVPHSSSSSASEDSSDAPEEELCGNDTIDAGEECDGADFNAAADECSELGFDSGNLSCSDECTLDVSECEIDCGNGVLDEGEECDATAPWGPDNPGATCNAQCNNVPGIGNGGGNGGDQCPESCDDEDPCTADSCNVNTLECVHADNGACSESSGSSDSSSSSSSACPEGEELTTTSILLVPKKPNHPAGQQGETFDEVDASIDVREGDTVEIRGYARGAGFRRHFTDDRVVFTTDFGESTVNYYQPSCTDDDREVGDTPIDATSLFVNGENVTKDVNIKFSDVCGVGTQHSEYYAWVTGCREEEEAAGSCEEEEVCDDEVAEIVVPADNQNGITFTNDGEAGTFSFVVYSPKCLSDDDYKDYTWANASPREEHRTHGGSLCGVILEEDQEDVEFSLGVSPDEPEGEPQIRPTCDGFLGVEETPYYDPPYVDNSQDAANAAYGDSFDLELDEGQSAAILVYDVLNGEGFADNEGSVTVKVCRGAAKNASSNASQAPRPNPNPPTSQASNSSASAEASNGSAASQCLPSSVGPDPEPSFCTPTGPNLLVNGNFEKPIIQNSYNSNMWQIYGGATAPGYFDAQPPIDGWQPETYQVELQRIGLVGIPAEGKQYAEIDVLEAVRLRQAVKTVQGAEYEVYFAYAPRPDVVSAQKVGVYWNGQLVGNAAGVGASGPILWGCHAIRVIGTGGMDVLGFGSLEGMNGNANFIDDVSLVQKTFPCPSSSQFADSSSSSSQSSNSSDDWITWYPPISSGASSAASNGSSAPGQCRGDECSRGGDVACMSQNKTCAAISNLPCIQCIAASSALSSSLSSAVASSSSRSSSLPASARSSSARPLIPVVSSSAAPIASSSTASRCALPNECGTNLCVDGACKECASDAECISGSCSQSGVCLASPNPFPSVFVPAHDNSIPPPSPLCGNDILNPGEECDDGNNRDLDGCSAYCFYEGGKCGDGVVQSLIGEQCEPLIPGIFPCANTCRFLLLSCGDGVLNLGEACDDGALNSVAPGARCRLDCSLARCGDLILDTGEECDDGNRLPGDTCDAFCRIERSGAPQALPAQIIDLPGYANRNCASDAQCAAGMRCVNGGCEVIRCSSDANCSSGTCLNGECLVAPGGSSSKPKPRPQQNAQTGPETVIVITAGAAAGWAWVRRRRG